MNRRLNKPSSFSSLKTLKNAFRSAGLGGMVAVALAMNGCHPSTPSSSEWQSPHHDRIVGLLTQMSLEQKVGQMTQLNLDVVSVGQIYQLEEPHRLDSTKLYHALVERHVGSILNVGGHAYPLAHWRDIIGQIQSVATTQTELRIPVLYGIDAIHGANYVQEGTLFPQPLAQAATFDPELVRRLAAITAYETRASGVPWNFSPVLDLGRQPLWSRFFETYGEDVLVARTLGRAAIEGYQGSNPSEHGKVAATMKHFLGYSMPWTGRDRTPVYVHDRQLREWFLPSFQEAVDAGCLTVMINSGELNGIPVHADSALLTGLLRDELGFRGLAVTDWEDLEKLVSVHRVATDYREAVKMAVNAGIDMAMVPNDYRFTDALIELGRSGEVPQKRIDEAVYRILHVKFSLGLFENPGPPSAQDYPLTASDSFREASLDAARHSLVLLKNEGGLLPLSAETPLALFGEPEQPWHWNGSWSRTWQGTDPRWDAAPGQPDLEAALDSVFTGAVVRTTSSSAAAPVWVVLMTEKPSTEKPGDIDDLDPDPEPLERIQTLLRQKKNAKVVLVLLHNRPRIVRTLEPFADAIVLAQQPGPFGSQAVAELLAGQFSPSGRLPYTYPKASNALLAYDHKATERLDPGFGMNAFAPQYPFGHGLSYAEFAYGPLVLSDSVWAGSDSLVVHCVVRNTSTHASWHTTLLFATDSTASVTPSHRRLRGFQKHFYEPGQERRLRFALHPRDLAFIDRNLRWTTEPGWFTLSMEGQKALVEYRPQ